MYMQLYKYMYTILTDHTINRISCQLSRVLCCNVLKNDLIAVFFTFTLETTVLYSSHTICVLLCSQNDELIGFQLPLPPVFLIPLQLPSSPFRFPFNLHCLCIQITLRILRILLAFRLLIEVSVCVGKYANSFRRFQFQWLMCCPR